MGEIVRMRTVSFTADRLPMPRKIRLGMEGDNLVERLRFALPVIAEHQTATLVITGRADAATLMNDEENGYYIDLTREIVGPDGETEAYIIIDGAGGESWRNDVMRLITGALPDVDEEIQQRYPGAVETMLGRIAEQNAEMDEQTERVEDAAKRAEDAAERAEAGGGGGGGAGEPGKDGGYYRPSVTDGVLTWTPSKADMPAVPDSDVRGPAGNDGKTAYQYAQDGGYTGTEAEFAAKLAQEIPEAEGDFELIERIVIDEDGVTAITRDKEPDGTKYNMARVYINALTTQSEAIGSIYTRADYTYVAMMANAISNTADGGIGQAVMEIKNGLLDGYGIGAKNTGTSTALNRYATNKNVPNRARAMSYIQIFATTALPIGSTIEIWGVRA